MYDVLGVKSLKVVEACHSPPFTRYSHPVMVLRVMLVDVREFIAGAAGANGVALITVEVAPEVMLPLQLAAVTITVMVLPISAATKVYVELFVPIVVAPRLHS